MPATTRSLLSVLGAAALPAALLLATPAVASASTNPIVDQASFSYQNGQSQTFTVPTGVTEVAIQASGGAGGPGNYFNNEQETIADGGPGGQVNADLPVTPGEVLTVDVGQAGGQVTGSAGGGGGGSGSGDGMDGGAGGDGVPAGGGYYDSIEGGGGGGGTAIYDGSQLILAAGSGGGGGGASGEGGAGLNGGAGGGGEQLSNPAGDGNGVSGAGVQGGSGGAFASAFSPEGQPGAAGSSYGGGGGGGGGGALLSSSGYFGGGLGGSVGSTSGGGGGGGGGGVSWASPDATAVTYGVGPTSGGSGSVSVSWNPSDVVSFTDSLSGSVNTGQPVTLTATVDTSGGTPSGTLTFAELPGSGTALPGCSNLTLEGSGNSGTATCTTHFTDAGSIPVEAAYSDGNFPPEDSSTTTVQVTAPATLHVTTGGSDASNTTCSEADPCATLAHAVDEATAGDIISLGGGHIPSGGAEIRIPLTIEGDGASTVLEPSAGTTDTIQLENSDDTLTDLTVAGVAPSVLDTPTPVIDSASENLTLSGVTVTGGYEGVYEIFGTAAIDHSTISDDITGVYEYDNTVTLDDSSVTGSLNDGLVNTGGVLDVLDSTVTGTEGPSGADEGLGLLNDGTTTVTDSTIAGNLGGGILADAYGTGETTVVDSTIGPNTGYGLVSLAAGGAHIAGSVLDGNTASDCGSAASGAIVDGGYNVSSDTTCGFTAADHDVAGRSADLGPLAANGGPTETAAPSSASPAIGLIPRGTTVTLGSTTGPLCAGTDQRGVARPDPAGTACDAGAVEVAPSASTLRSTVSGQKATLTATVAAVPEAGQPALPKPAGSETFSVNGHPVSGCEGVAVKAGSATCETTLPTGTDHLAAAYTGTNGYGASTAAADSVVGAARTTTTVHSDPSTVTAGAETLVAAVVTAPGAPRPKGSVRFTVGSTPVAGCLAVLLKDGTATCRIRFDRTGTRTVRAAYGGSAADEPSSGRATVTVRAR